MPSICRVSASASSAWIKAVSDEASDEVSLGKGALESTESTYYGSIETVRYNRAGGSKHRPKYEALQILTNGLFRGFIL